MASTGLDHAGRKSSRGNFIIAAVAAVVDVKDRAEILDFELAGHAGAEAHPSLGNWKVATTPTKVRPGQRPTHAGLRSQSAQSQK